MKKNVMKGCIGFREITYFLIASRGDQINQSDPLYHSEQEMYINTTDTHLMHYQSNLPCYIFFFKSIEITGSFIKFSSSYIYLDILLLLSQLFCKNLLLYLSFILIVFLLHCKILYSLSVSKSNMYFNIS